MVTVGVLAQFEAKPGNEAAVERFLNEGRPIAQQYKASTFWYAFRLGPTTFGAFAAFADEEARDVLLKGGGPALAEKQAELFAVPPIFEMVDVLAAMYPKGENSETVGSLVHFKVKSGKEAAWERVLKKALGAIQEVPTTIAWFAFRLGPASFGVFDTFSDEASQQAHFLDGTAYTEKTSDLLEMPPVVEKIHIFATRLPG